MLDQFWRQRLARLAVVFAILAFFVYAAGVDAEPTILHAADQSSRPALSCSTKHAGRTWIVTFGRLGKTETFG